MKNVKISEVLHLAADKYLAISNEEYIAHIGKRKYSCDSIRYALLELVDRVYDRIDLHDRIEAGLTSLGLITYSTQQFSEFDNFVYFNDYEGAEKSQGARYTWLKFCAMLAEEQGV